MTGQGYYPRAALCGVGNFLCPDSNSLSSLPRGRITSALKPGWNYANKLFFVLTTGWLNASKKDKLISNLKGLNVELTTVCGLLDWTLL